MPLYNWSDEYNTHIRAIDTDHKNLFEAVNILHDAYVSNTVEERIFPILTKLHTYVEEHFQREERFMEQAGYPHLTEHRTVHRKFTRLILDLEQLCKIDLPSVDIEKVLAFLGTWLQDHILGTDMKYVPYLRGEKPGTPEQIEPEPHDLVKLTFNVPHEKVALVERFVRALSTGGAGERFESSLNTALDKIEASELSYARKLFSKDD